MNPQNSGIPLKNPRVMEGSGDGNYPDFVSKSVFACMFCPPGLYTSLYWKNGTGVKKQNSMKPNELTGFFPKTLSQFHTRRGGFLEEAATVSQNGKTANLLSVTLDSLASGTGASRHLDLCQ